MQILVQLLPLILLFAVMYFLMIRPQKKKDKQIQDMRKSLQVGDEIVTIGGICGKIVKTKDESFIIQVGADKVKFEMMRWAVSSVTKPSPRRDVVDDVKEEEPKKIMPKRLRKSSEVEEMEAQETPAAEKTEEE
ncbi:MAG: preprotein translocase subunit YajC [Anaerovoracaceae bacterium]